MKVKLIRSAGEVPEKTSYTNISIKESHQTKSFNGMEAVPTRHIRIAGVNLVWDGTTNMQGSDSSKLYNLNGSKDIQSLEMYADEVIIRSPLHFPQTDVRIFARNLAFEGKGSISTTPLPFSISKARQKNRSAEGDRPLDESKQIKAADGLNGLNGGSISLQISGKITASDTTTKRLITKGSNGQDAEEGGYLKYQPFANQNPVLLRPGSLQMRLPNLKDSVKYQINHLWPKYKGIPRHDWESFFDQNNVVYVEINGYNDSFLGIADCNGNKTHNSLVRIGQQIWPASGPDAYPSGKPGNGGNSGTITANLHSFWSNNMEFDFQFLIERETSTPGKPTMPVPAIPAEAVADGKRFAFINMDLVLDDGGIRSPRTPKLSITYPEKEIRSGIGQPSKVGEPGKGPEIKTNSSNVKVPVSPLALEYAIRYAKDALVYGNPNPDEESNLNEKDRYGKKLARDILAPYRQVLSNTTAILPLELRALKTEMESLFKKIDVNLDYYNHAPGWLPRLSSLSNLNLFKAEQESALKMMYYAYILQNRWDKMADQQSLLQESNNSLNKEIENARQNYTHALDMLDDAKTSFEQIQENIDGVKEELKLLKSNMEQEAGYMDQNQKLVSGIFRIGSTICKSFPVGQPYIGSAGTLLDAAAEIDINSDDALNEGFKFAGSLSGNIASFTKDHKAMFVEGVGDSFLNEIQKAENSIQATKSQFEKTQSDLSKLKSVSSDTDKAELNQNIADLDSGSEDLEVAAKTKILTKLEAKEADLNRRVEELQQAKAKREEQLNEAFNKVEQVSKGAEAISSELQKMFTKVTPDDLKPYIEKLAQTKYHSQLEKIRLSLETLNEQKLRLAETIQRSQTMMAESSATINKNLVQSLAFTRQLQNLTGGLSLEVRTYAQDIQRRAEERINQYMYHYIKSYEYQYLMSIPKHLFNTQMIFEKIKKFQETANGELLSEEAFEEIHKNVIQEKFSGMATSIITQLQSIGPSLNYKYCLKLSDQQLAVLNDNWEIRFNLIEDFKAGSQLDSDCRIISIAFSKLEIETPDKGLVLDFSFTHSGVSTILAPDRNYYRFTKGKYPVVDQSRSNKVIWIDETPISWPAIYNHSDPESIKLFTPEIDNDHKLELFLLAGYDKKDAQMFKEHRPGYNSDIILSIDKKRREAKKKNWKDKSFTIKQLDFHVFFEKKSI